MKCPKCQFENIENSTFCVKCGTNLKEIQNINIEMQNSTNNLNGNINNNVNYENTPTSSTDYLESQKIQNIQEPVMNNQSRSISSESLNYIMFIVAVLMKPFKCFKEEEAKLSNAKTSVVFTIIISVIMTLVTLVKKVIATVITKTMDTSSFKLKTTVDFSQLKELDWMGLLFKNLLIYIAIVVVIALVYYIISLMFKKNSDFIKMLSISATSLIPFIIIGMIASPILGIVWAPLSTIIMCIGVVYSLLIFIALMDEEISFNDANIRIYFHLICLSILGSAGYYCYMKFMTSAVPSNIKNVLNLIK